MPDLETASRPAKTTRLRRWRRRIGWVAAAFVILLAAVWFLHPQLLRPMVAQRLSRALDADVQVSAARLTIGGQLRIEQVRAEGDAFFDTLGAVRADLGWASLLRGEFRPRRVRLQGLTLAASRFVSEDDDVRTPKLKALADEPALSRLERLEIEGASILLDENGGRLVFDAEARRRDAAGRYDVTILAGGEHVAAGPQSFAGMVDLPGGSARISGADVPLRPWLTVAGDPARRASGTLQGGTLTSFTLIHQDDAGFRVEGVVADVATSLPGVDSGDDDAPVHALRGAFAYSASGISADLRGKFDGAPLSLSLDGSGDFWTSGVEIQAEVSDLPVGSDSAAYAVLPARVMEQVAQFSHPTGLVNGTAEARVTPATGAMSIGGHLQLSEAQAMYTGFPYRFEHISAEIDFSETRLSIRQLQGRSPTGATIRGHATVTPLTDGASVNVDLTVTDLPLDDALRQAMSSQQREVLRTFFHPNPSEILSDPAAPPSLRESEFQVGGIASVGVLVSREGRVNAPYDTKVQAEFHEAGLLSDRFPYPLIARDLRLEIGDEEASAATERISGLTGASGRLSARVDLGDEDASDLAPTVEIEMTSLPVDGMLIWAIDQSQRSGAAGGGLRATLEQLGLGGTITGTVRAGPNPTGVQRLTIDADLAGLSMEPQPFDPQQAGPRLSLSDFSGEFHAGSDGWQLGPASAAIGSGRVELEASGAVSSRDGSPLVSQSKFNVQDVDLSLPVEDVIAVLAPEVARTVADAREAFRPNGPVDASGTIDATAEALRTADVTVSLKGLAEIDALGGRAGVAGESGRIKITHDGIQLHELAGAGSFNQKPLGGVVVDGRFDFSGNGDLAVQVSRGALGNPAAPAILERFAGTQAAQRYRGADVAGRVDGSADLTFKSGNAALARMAIRPRKLSFTRGGARVKIAESEGEITFDDGQGVIRDLSLTSDGWTVRLDGDWSVDAGVGADLSISAIGDELDSSLLGLLPEAASGALRALNVRTPSGFTLQDGRLVITSAAEEGVPVIDRVSFDGLVWTSSGALDVGVPVRGAAGEAAVQYRFSRDGNRGLQIDLDLERLTLAGTRVENVAGRLQAPPASGRATLQLNGESHRGRWTADGAFWTDGSGRFDVALRVAGLDLSTLTQVAETEAPAQDAEAEVEGAGSRVDGHLTIAGRAGDAASIRGRGSARVTGGGVLRLPIAAQVLELATLQPPTGERLDFAESRFFIDGQRIVFESLFATSRSIAMLGEGSMTWPDLALDLRFRTRGNLRAPFLSDVVDALRNELLTAQVNGTLMQPQVQIVQLSATRRLFAEMLTGRRTPATRTTITDGAVRSVQPEPRE